MNYPLIERLTLSILHESASEEEYLTDRLLDFLVSLEEIDRKKLIAEISQINALDAIDLDNATDAIGLSWQFEEPRKFFRTIASIAGLF